MARLRVYFDICALKRGWDDHTQLRVKLEADAMEYLTKCAAGGVLEIVHSAVPHVENQGNTNKSRRAAVEEFLGTYPMHHVDMTKTRLIMERLSDASIIGPDAAHLAAAVLAGADTFVTTDDRLPSRASAARGVLRGMRVTGPLELASEVVS